MAATLSGWGHWLWCLGCSIGLLISATHTFAADPRINYLLHCGGCHLADGSGSPPEIPSLVDELGRLVAIPEGRDYLARVPGASQAPISDAALADVLNWVLVQFNQASLPEGFKVISAKEVKQSRVRVLADPLKYREQFWPEAKGY